MLMNSNLSETAPDLQELKMTKVVMARGCILLVDDEPPFLAPVKNFLENSKLEVAGSGLLEDSAYVAKWLRS